jgi:FkbM family methyltransferase
VQTLSTDNATLLRQLEETKGAGADKAALQRQLDEVKDAFARDNAALQQQLDKTNKALAKEQDFTRRLRSSASWRVTAPIRAAVNFLRSLLVRQSARAKALPSARHESDLRPGSKPSHRSATTRAPFHVDASDKRGRDLLLSGGDLSPPSLAIWRCLLSERPWTHVLDIGANYGEMLLNVTLPPSARVLAFEPNPRISTYLEWNLSEAGIPAEIIRSAVSNRIGKATLRIDQEWSGHTSLASTPGDAAATQALEFMTVPTTTISAVLANSMNSGPHVLIKIDVEGHEVAVLEGAMQVLDGLAGFAAMAELSHLSPQDREWILDRFDVELLDQQTNRLVRLHPATPEGLSAILAKGKRERLYIQDVVLRRKPQALDRGSAPQSTT